MFFFGKRQGGQVANATEYKKYHGIAAQRDAYLRYCSVDRGMAQTTMRQKIYSIDYLIRDSKIKDLDDLTNDHISHWIESMKKEGNCNRTINDRLRQTVPFFKWARDEGVTIPGLRITRIRRLPEPAPIRKIVTREEVNKVLSYADRQEWLLIMLFFDTGMRLSEVRNLRLCDIQGNKITFIGKGAKTGVVYMSKEVQQRLEDWIKREKVTNYIWQSRSPQVKGEQPISGSVIQKIIRRAFERAGIEGMHPHALRYSMATESNRMGAPIDVTQRLLRHSNVSTTQMYIQIDDDELRQEFETYRQKAITGEIR